MLDLDPSVITTKNATVSDSSQVVDDFETHLTEASAKCDRNKGKYERIAKVLIDLKTGVDHLATKLVSIKLDGKFSMLSCSSSSCSSSYS